MRDVAIIGSGAAESAFISELAFQISNNLQTKTILSGKTAIHIFDEATLLGAGLPYNSMMTDAEHLLNIQTVSGSIPKDFSASFFDWINSNKDEIEKRFQLIFEDRFKEKFKKRFAQEFEQEKYDEYQQIKGFTELKKHYENLWISFKKRYLNFKKAKDFHPRILYGMFSVDNFLKDITVLKANGIEVVLHNKSKVLALNNFDNYSILSFAEDGEIKNGNFAKIFIATGMMDDQKENEINSPIITKIWPIKELKDRVTKLIDEAKHSGKSEVKIAIKGTELAAIDLVKTIFTKDFLKMAKTAN